MLLPRFRAASRCAFLCLSLLAVVAAAAEVDVRRDIEYAKVGETSLKLDLYIPPGEIQPPLIAWVHGGAWRAGSKEDMPLKGLLARGFAVASIDYRLSTVAPFPAQAHDLKAALRFLRTKAGAYGLDGQKIAIAGGSAGGHLAALVGVSSGEPELEGNEGPFPSASSAVMAIISYYGASNLSTILAQSTPHGLTVREPALRLLLGGLPEEKPELARLASPVAHVRPGSPPLLLIHGDADPQMPYQQALELQRAYQQAKLPVILETIAGGQHGGAQFYDDRRSDLAAHFLIDALRHPREPAPTHAEVSYGPSRHQVMDVYLPAASDHPAPILVWYGGIWRPGKGAPDPARLLKAGIAVAAVGTRTMNDAQREHASPPIAWVMQDALRAVQFVRHSAAQWNLEASHIAVGGGSQGSLPALFVGCAGERAQPHAADPVARESTAVACVVAFRSQPTLDPQLMQSWVPGVKWGAPALGVSFEESLARREALLPLLRQWSPDALLHAGAAPIFFEYNWPLTQPEGVGEMDYKVHSPAWALGFQKLAEQAGVECQVAFPGHPAPGGKDFFEYLARKLQPARQ